MFREKTLERHLRKVQKNRQSVYVRTKAFGGESGSSYRNAVVVDVGTDFLEIRSGDSIVHNAISNHERQTIIPIGHIEYINFKTEKAKRE